MAVARRKSLVWQHFTISATDDAKAICNHCGDSLSRGGKNKKAFNTTNLRKHLETLHPILFTQLLKDEKEQVAAKSSGECISHQPTLKEVLDAKRPYEFDHPNARKIHKAVGEMIALDNEPFSIVKRDGFKRLMNVVEPQYTLPSDKYFSETLLPSMYTKVSNKLSVLACSWEHFSVTTDLWSSVAQDSYLSLTAHFISPEYEWKQACLHAVPFNGSHTGPEIAAMIRNCLQAWGIYNKLHVVVRDNGSNFVAGLRNASIPNLPCLAHTLQLVIKDGCLTQPCITALTAKARKLVGHYKHSNVACKTLERIQEQLQCPRHRLIQDEPTRWNTTFYMLERLLEQRKAITTANVELNVTVELQTSNWVLAEKVVKILRIFEEATTAASSNHASAALVIPVVNSILRSLQEGNSTEDSGVTRMKREMLSSLQTRYTGMESNKFYAVATLLDPRFKLKVFSTSSSKALAKQMLIAECEELISTTDLTEPSSKRPRVDESNREESLLWTYCDQLMDKPDDEESDSVEDAGTIVEKYLKEANEPRNSNPLLYWKKHKDTRPILTSLALRYLTCPASTVASERLFSAAGSILTESRNRLSPDKLDKLLFLHHNLKLVNYDY